MDLFGMPDPDQQQIQKPDPTPHQSKNSGAVEVRNEAMEGR
jgi:hypothetical protein